MPKPTELYTFRATAVAVTEKAVCVTIDKERYWLPLSQVREPDPSGIDAEDMGVEQEFTITAWLAREKGLI